MRKMKFLLKPFFYFILICTIIISCKTDDDSKNDINQNPNSGYIEVQVILPNGSTINLSETTLFSLGELALVNNNGTAQVPVYGQNLELAFLFDNNGNALLAGFISEDKTEISIVSTAEVLSYFSSTLYLGNPNLKSEALLEINTLPGFSEFTNQLSAGFITNPLMLKNGLYTGNLQSFINTVLASATQTDISYNRLSLDENDKRSGLSISELSDDQFRVTNDYPKNAHAFVYEKSYIDEFNQEISLNQVIDPDDTANFDFDIDPAIIKPIYANKPAPNGVFFSCHTQIYDSNNSGAQTLSIENDQLAKTYEVAIVSLGAGNPSRAMSNVERSTFEDLSMKIFTTNYLLPLMMEISGRKSDLFALEGEKDTQLTSTIKPYIENNETVRQLIFDNDFESAFDTYIEELYSNGTTGYGEAFDIMIDVYGVISDDGNQPFNYVLNDEKKSYVAEIAKIIDNAASLISYTCMNETIASSKKLEAFEITVEQGKVRLRPEVMVTSNTSDGKIITANIISGTQNGDQYEYHWTTSTNFGGFLSEVGNTGNNGSVMTTTTNEVYFISTASNSQLSDGDNIETVTVTVYNTNGGNDEEIGSDTMDVYVKKDAFEISPDGITIQGDTNLTLYITNDNGSTIPNEDTDYKVVWTTTANHGLMTGTASSWTTYNTNQITYEAFDNETLNGSDTVRAVIYAKPTNSNEEYRLIDDIEATIHIENDPEEIIFHVPVSVDINPIAPSGDGWFNYSIFTVWEFEPLSDSDSRIPDGYEIERYIIRIVERIPDLIPSCQGNSETWLAENQEQDLNEDGKYSIFCGYSSGSSLETVNLQEAFNTALNYLNGTKGYAEVTVKLVPIN